jgi:hypothetical protein
MLKKLISSIDDKFYVRLFDKNNECIIVVDNFFPFFSETNEPLFLSLEN